MRSNTVHRCLKQHFTGIWVFKSKISPCGAQPWRCLNFIDFEVFTSRQFGTKRSKLPEHRSVPFQASWESSVRMPKTLTQPVAGFYPTATVRNCVKQLKGEAAYAFFKNERVLAPFAATFPPFLFSRRQSICLGCRNVIIPFTASWNLNVHFPVFQINALVTKTMLHPQPS